MVKLRSNTTQSSGTWNLIFKGCYKNGEEGNSTGDEKIENGNKAENWMIGLVFKLGFVPFFFFLFPVLVPCSPFRVLVTSIFSQSEQTFVRHIVSRPIGTGFFTCDLVNKCIMPSFPLKTYRDLGAVGEGGGGGWQIVG